MPPGKRPREPVGAAERHGARLRRALSDPVYRFAWAVIVAGAGVLAALVATGAFDWVTHPAAKPLLFVALVICAETVQLKSPRQHDDSVTSASDLFAFTALLLYGPGEAAAGFIGGVLVTGAMRRLPPVKVTFNAAQYVVALGASAAVLAALSNVPHAAGSPFAASDLPAICLAALPLFAINDVLTATVSSLAMGVPPRVHVRRDLPRMLALDGVLVGFAPVMAVSVHFSAAMLPLLALPFATVLYTTREAERREYAATHDALTGLANRIRFRAAVEQELQRARHTGATVAVLALDVDNFKDFNDTLGHNEADSLLIQVAARLRVAAGPRDLVARLGGDDFALLVVGDVDAAQLAELAARLRSALDDQFAVSGLRVGVSASVGMAWSPEHAADAATLLRRSDVAVQLAKLRHAGIEVYDRASDPYSPERLVLAAQLREAIPRGELVLHYQPKLAVESGEVVGVESLVRWRHPTRGLMPPAEFIELAERTDVIGALTMNVLRMALGQVAAWRRVGVELPVAVNLPGQMLLDRDLPRDIASLLARLGLPATCLMVEITESSLIHDPHRSAQILDVLSAMGTRVAIDDFGTGYSSLAWLKRFPVDEIKVDRSFVTELDANESDAAIVRSTIELGRSLGVSVVAEGVETAAVLERLAAYGCDVVQGFLISRPVPAAQLLTWLRGRTHVSGEHSEVSRPSYEL